ncbi:hypothetical protein KY335_04730 [Candidatus Woesearchaeota archaeon]|nr:hypothetical protein [Candidatus Woesearchaeota archaeon]MBW3014513.1 hypothetical protein [Candidatus Woesearchaeota archaeon]
MDDRGAIELVWTVIVLILVAVLSLIILTFFLQSTGKGAEQLQEDVMCKLSVEEAVRTGDWFGDVIICPTKYHELKKTKADEVKSLVAKRAAVCWDKFGRGKKLLFEHSPSLFGSDKAAYCNVCDVFEFENVEPIYDLGSYLTKNNVSKYYSAEPKSYFEFLNHVMLSSNDKIEIENTVLRQVGIDTSKPYAIVFVYTKDPRFFSVKYFLGEASKNYLPAKFYFNSLSFLLGYDDLADWDARIALVPYNKAELQKACEYLEE